VRQWEVVVVQTGVAGTPGAALWTGIAEHEPAVRAFLARRCRNQAELDDVVQETLLRAARYRSGLTDGSRLRGWLLRIARNCLKDHVRRERRLPCVNLPDPLEEIESREPDPGAPAEQLSVGRNGEVIEKDDAITELGRVLVGMQALDQRVLRSYYGRSRPPCCAVVARECDIPRDLVKVRLFRARRRLLRTLAQRLDPRLRVADSSRRARAREGVA
jgi:RNA polymerase sigma-70 factor (ECF subfamily)